MQKRIIILAWLLAAGVAVATNFPAPYRIAVQTDTNGVIVSPTNFLSANDVASAASAGAVAAAFSAHTTTAAAVFSTVADVSNRTQHISARGEAYQYQATWDLASSSGTSEWVYLNGAAWVTNSGARLSGGALDCTTNAPILRWAGAQTDVVYRVTWTGVASGGGGSSFVSVYFPPTAEEIVLYGTNSYTFTHIFTNAGVQIGFRRCSVYYHAANISSVTIESGSEIPDPATIIATEFLPGAINLAIGSPSAPFGPVYASGIGLTDVLEPRPTIVTNADITLYTPRWVGEALVDVGSNKTYRAYGSTTNDWGD